MLVKCSVDTLEYETISHSVTLVPRLEYSITLLDEIIVILKKKRNDLKKSNKDLVDDFNENDQIFLKSIELERIVVFSLETLFQVKKRTGNISSVSSIPEVLLSSIPMIRTVSAQLFDIVPNCSQMLSEISVHLGSIVLDSAALTKARFDFSQSNEESSTLLDKVKLMVDSKISKQYPNLNFFKSCNV
ncbi:MAG: hypothetical protein OEM77_03865 [Nitrosopumilus sp.]|nr:hypothetical protein [Nitrosopumilus sp.]MDH3737279.1 hypothetical protein [Nitrosopumilus sp.]MDH3822663.1 hypothetical protein [Nitrosopumilus sp.]MDH3833160.1 hypothetical protein [Nitrosopumilus sp.]